MVIYMQATTTTVRITHRTRQAIKVASAVRGVSMLDAIEEAASAWLRTSGGSLNKTATEAPRSRPQRRKSA